MIKNTVYLIIILCLFSCKKESTDLNEDFKRISKPVSTIEIINDFEETKNQINSMKNGFISNLGEFIMPFDSQIHSKLNLENSRFLHCEPDLPFFVDGLAVSDFSGNNLKLWLGLNYAYNGICDVVDISWEINNSTIESIEYVSLDQCETETPISIICRIQSTDGENVYESVIDFSVKLNESNDGAASKVMSELRQDISSISLINGNTIDINCGSGIAAFAIIVP